MENTADSESFRVTQLTALNTAKVLTILLLVTFAWVFGVQNRRQVLYLCLQLTYCLWWLLEQRVYPQWRQQMMGKSVGVGGVVSALLLAGSLYALPGYLAFINPEPLSLMVIIVALPLFIIGSLIHSRANLNKFTAEQDKVGLVSYGRWHFSSNINYFGNLLRYLSFSIVAGSIWAYLIQGMIALLYLQGIFQKEQARLQQNQDNEEYQPSNSRLIPFVW